MAVQCSWGLISALSYGTVAIGANFVTKYAMKVFPMPNTILLMQLITMLLVILAARAAGLVSKHPCSLKRCRHLLPLSCAFVAHAAFVLRSLAILNIAIYNTLKRLTPIMVLCAKIFLDRRLPALREAMAVFLVVGGCFIAGFGDLSFDALGYALALLCTAIQATYILLTEYADVEQKYAHHSSHLPSISRPISQLDEEMQALKSTITRRSPDSHTTGASQLGLDSLSTAAAPGDAGSAGIDAAGDLLMYMSASGIPMLLIALFVSDELSTLSPALASAYDTLGGSVGPSLTGLITLALNELALTFTMVWCTQSNGALTATIVGVLKSALAIPLGMMFLADDAKFGAGNIIGMAIVAVGGAWYSAMKAGMAKR